MSSLMNAGYAPGYYTGKCRVCGSQYMGAKRSWSCEPCAREALETVEEPKVLYRWKVFVNPRIVYYLDSQEQLQRRVSYLAERCHPGQSVVVERIKEEKQDDVTE